MYITRGWNVTELTNPDVIVHEDRLHFFHTLAPSNDTLAHMVSEDGMRWTPLSCDMRTGDPGDADDDQIRTFHIFRLGGRFAMLYTALAQAEDGHLQRTGLAFSDDLVHWEKSPQNPVAEPDPRWYEADLSASGRADWRDPFPWADKDGRLHALLCAHEKDGPLNRRGCVARITGDDGLRWRVVEPFYTPRISTDFEVPCLFRLGGRYYLMVHICAPSIDVYRVADRFEGPWRRPMDDILLPSGNHAFHAVTWRDKVLIFNWISGEDWNGSGQRTRLMPPPKIAHGAADGALSLLPFDEGWGRTAAGPWAVLPVEDIPSKGAAYRGEWAVADGALAGDCRPGMGIQFLPGEWDDFDLEVALASSDAPEAGVVFRSDEIADRCMRVAWVPGRRSVELAVVVLRSNYNALGRGYDLVQSRYTPLDPRESFRMRVIACGPYIEVSVNGRVRLSAMRMPRRGGRVGLFVEDGATRFGDIRLRPLNAPALRLPLGPLSAASPDVNENPAAEKGNLSQEQQ